MKKLLYVTNIPAPYRQKRFNKMQEIFPKMGIDFEVLYMAKIEPNRKWIIPKESFKYKYKIFKGIHPVIGKFFAHFNPGLLIRLLKNDYDIVVIGGMASPTHWLAPFFVSNKKIKILSVESNLLSVGRKSGIGAKIKTILINKANAYQVTGTPQKEYIKFFSPSSSQKSFIKLPNLIDEQVFVEQVKELRNKKKYLKLELGINEESQIWVLPAQHIDKKGIIPFLKLLSSDLNVKLFLLGDGPLRNEIESLVLEMKLNVVVVGHVQQEDIIKYYAIADLFIIPSIKDPSPLSPIEAIAAGLPILVSSRIGNVEDVLVDELNGWSYDPVNEIDKGRKLITQIASLSHDELSKKGLESEKIYNAKFDTNKCVESYAKSLLKIN